MSVTFDIMIDIETLALHPQFAWILSAAVVPFCTDGSRPPILESWPAFAIRFGDDVREHPRQIPRVVDSSTLLWWFDDARAAARSELAKLAEFEYTEGLQRIADYIAAADNVWARGPQFDLSNIWTQCSMRDIEIKKTPYQWRDSRSLSDLLGSKAYREFMERANKCPHSALHDAIAEVEFVQFMHIFIDENMDKTLTKNARH